MLLCATESPTCVFQVLLHSLCRLLSAQSSQTFCSLCEDLQLRFAAAANWLAVLSCAVATFVEPDYIIYAVLGLLPCDQWCLPVPAGYLYGVVGRIDTVSLSSCC